ncbi:hypothetical protein A3K72_03110 [Candidatus Woesearchaeota archaeon RBG_13_36_6]|nr:MAG: hypothetical protein A3K72_03110 [Candidatus Woesearchaeota archaeon RBG_13_36_6]
MVVLDVEGIKELNLESRLYGFLEKSKPQTIARFRALEQALEQEILEVAEETGLNPTFPDYLAYLYHIEKMSCMEIADYLQEKSNVEIKQIDYGVVYRWMGCFGIPSRNTSEAQRIREIKKGSYTDIGLLKSEFRVLVYAARGYNIQQTADLLEISVDTVKVHRKSVLKKLGVDGYSLHDVTRAIILGYEFGWFGKEKVESILGEDIDIHPSLARAIKSYK